MTGGIPVDGERPAVEWVTALPRDWRVTPPERLILLCLACDSYQWESAPGFEAIAEWTGMQRTSCIEILARLCDKTLERPALLERISVRGRRRTIFRIVPVPPEPVGHADRLPADDQPQPSANRSAPQNGSSISPTVGESVGVADRLEPPTVGEPSANRSATPTAPFPLNQTPNPNTKPLGDAADADAASDDDNALFEAVAQAAKQKRKAKPKKAPDPIAIEANALCRIWWDALPVPPTGPRAFPNVSTIVARDLAAGRTPEQVTAALAACGSAVTANALNFQYEQQSRQRNGSNGHRPVSEGYHAGIALARRLHAEEQAAITGEAS